MAPTVGRSGPPVNFIVLGPEYFNIFQDQRPK